MRFFSRLLSTLAIEIKDNRASCLKGKVTQKTLNEISQICRENHIPSAEIWLSGNGQVSFSPEIPDSLHQRLRNCMVQSQY